MKNWILKILVSSMAVFFTSLLLNGVWVKSFGAALLFAFVLSFLNMFFRPILIILTIPITVITFGIFLLFINTLVIILADYLLDDVYIRNFWWALLFSFILTFMTSLLENIFGTKKKMRDELRN